MQQWPTRRSRCTKRPRMQPTSPMRSRISTRSTGGTSTTTSAGHYLTAADSRDVPMRIRGDVDEAIPSATSQIIEAFARVATATGRIDLLDRAWAIAEAASGRIRNQAYGQAGIVNACAILEGSRKLVLVDDPNTPDAVAGRRTPSRSAPRRSSSCRSAQQPVELPGASTSTPAGRQPGFASGQSCLPPITDPGRRCEKAAANHGRKSGLR